MSFCREFPRHHVWLLSVSSCQDAAIVNDYLTGRCGLKATSVFSQAGVGWPLETIVGVAAFEDAERERNQGALATCVPL